jgi:hypothetical protein
MNAEFKVLELGKREGDGGLAKGRVRGRKNKTPI